MVRSIALRQFLWHFYFGDFEAASWRWIVSIFVMLMLFPGVGSGGSFMAICIWLFAVPYWIWDSESRRLTHGETGLVAVFGAYFLISIGFATGHAFLGDGERSIGLAWNNLPFLLVAPAFTVLRRAARAYWAEMVFAGIACGALLAATIVSIGGQFSEQVMRAGFSGNELILGLGALVSGLLSVHGAMSFSGRVRWLCLAGAAAGLYALILSGSRGPLLSFCITLVIYMVVMGYRYHGVRWMMTRALIWAAVLASVGAVTITLDPQLVKRYALAVERLSDPESAHIDEESVRIRLVLYESAMRAFSERPLTGYGRQNAVAAVAPHSEGVPDRYFYYSHLHSGYLTDLISSGILGLLSLLAVLFVPLIVFWRASPLICGGILCTVCAFAFYGLTNLLFYHDVLTFLFLSLVCVFSALAGREREAVAQTG